MNGKEMQQEAIYEKRISNYDLRNSGRNEQQTTKQK